VIKIDLSGHAGAVLAEVVCACVVPPAPSPLAVLIINI
jgi:hypothetical protein